MGDAPLITPYELRAEASVAMETDVYLAGVLRRAARALEFAQLTIRRAEVLATDRLVLSIPRQVSPDEAVALGAAAARWAGVPTERVLVLAEGVEVGAVDVAELKER